MAKEKSICDPPVPYIGPIYGGRFGPGKMVRIQGTVASISYRFDINLQCGPETSPRDDIAMQVSVRILDGYISLNSLHNGIWGDEQRGTTSPIKRAEKFEIILVCDFDQYKVAINGQHYCEFPQRIHYDRITHLAIDGDVSVIQISYEWASEDGMGTASGSGFGGVPRATAPISLPSTEDETDNFELLDSATTTAALPGLHPTPSIGFSQLPSYDAAMHSNTGKSSSQPFSAGAPYPTSAAYPTGAPYPTTGVPYPTGPGVSPYPADGVTGTPYPTGIPGILGISPYPPPGAPGIPRPPPGAPVPLNAASSNFRPVQRSGWQKCCAGCCGIIITVVIIIVVVLVKSRKHSSYSSDSYHSSSHDSYGNSYSYESDSYGG